MSEFNAHTHTSFDVRRLPELVEFAELGDERGNLVVIDGIRNIPFDPKRVFYIYNSDADVVRGEHANKYTEFVLVNVSGKSKVKTDDGKGNVQIFSLDKPHIGVYIPKMYWKDMYDFSKDSVLLVLASEHYNGSEYIRSYDNFLKLNGHLRLPEVKDVSRMLEWMNNPEVAKQFYFLDNGISEKQVLNFINSARNYEQGVSNDLHVVWANNEDDIYQGTLSLKDIDRKNRKTAEFAIAFHPDAQGQGMAEHACLQLFDYANKFLGLETMHLNCKIDNSRAIGFYRKLGFIKTHEDDNLVYMIKDLSVTPTEVQKKRQTNEN